MRPIVLPFLLQRRLQIIIKRFLGKRLIRLEFIEDFHSFEQIGSTWQSFSWLWQSFSAYSEGIEQTQTGVETHDDH
jgi:hypothetical protein